MTGKDLEMPKDDLLEMGRELLTRLHSANLLHLYEEYWSLRANRIMREKVDIMNWAAEKVADGRFSICQDTADEAKSARKLFEENANSEISSTIPTRGLTAV